MIDIDSHIIIKYLIDIGWHEVNDKRFKQCIIGDIYDRFPNISIKSVTEVINIIIN